MSDLPNPFAEAVGEAILEWQKVEGGMAALFSALAEMWDDKICGIIYHRLGNTNQKLLAINELVGHQVKERERQNTWSDLLNRLKLAVELRNKLVHWVDDIEIGDTSVRPIPITLVMRPPSTDVKLRNKPPLSYEEIKALHGLFHGLAEELQAFVAVFWQPKT